MKKSSTEPIIINNNNNNSSSSSSSAAAAATVGFGIGRVKNKWITLVLCICFGFLGAHKFYEGKAIMGILYFCTCGLFFVGIVIDVIALLGKPTIYYV